MPEIKDRAPNSGRQRGSGTPRSNPRGLQTRLETFFAQFGLLFSAVGDQHCAMVIARGAPNLADAWVNLANESPAVRKTLENMLKGGAWSGVILATLGVAIPIAAHHNLVPAQFAGFFGAEPPTPSGASEPAQNGTSPHGPNIPTTAPPTGTVGTAGEPIPGTETPEPSGSEGIQPGGSGNVE